jgi:ERCC4-type nuclease
MLYIDNRETDLISKLNDTPEMTVKQLVVGDIWLGVNADGKMTEGGIIIERKSVADFEASFLDGRYREQRGRILAYCQENKTQPMYILEGSWSSNTGRIQKKAIMKLINRLIFSFTCCFNSFLYFFQTLGIEHFS